MRHLHAGEPFRRPRAAQVVADPARQHQRVELRLMRPPVEERAAGDTVLIPSSLCFRNHHDTVRVGIGQRPQQRCVEHAVDCSVGANAEREHQGGDCRKSWAACQQPQAEPGVLLELGCELSEAPAAFDAVVEARDCRRSGLEASEFREGLASQRPPLTCRPSSGPPCACRCGSRLRHSRRRARRRRCDRGGGRSSWCRAAAWGYLGGFYWRSRTWTIGEGGMFHSPRIDRRACPR